MTAMTKEPRRLLAKCRRSRRRSSVLSASISSIAGLRIELPLIKCKTLNLLPFPVNNNATEYLISSKQ